MGTKGSATTTTATQPNPQAMAQYETLLSQAQNVANTPYQAYGGEGVAGVNPEQYSGISGINSYANAAQPAIQTAEGMATAAASPITAAQIQNYENPYTQQVVDSTQAQFNNENAQQNQGVISNAAAQGALGGNRVGVAEANLANQQQLAQAPVIAGLESSGYTQGVNTALTEQQALASGAYSLGNLGVSGQNAGLTGANAQVGAGSLEQQTQQAQDTYNYQQYLNQLAFPYQQLGWESGIDTGVGSQMGGTSQTTAPPPNQLAQYLGLGVAGAGMFAAPAGGTSAAAGLGSAFSSALPALAAFASGGAVHHTGVAPDQYTVPESHETLLAQQRQLIHGHRRVQMFPHGTSELNTPHGMGRVVGHSGVFHFDPKKVDAGHIKHLSEQGREHELLDLGPISKNEVISRVQHGEVPLAVVERQPNGVEVRAAIGTHTTVHHQIAAMHHTKSPGNSIHIEDPRETLVRRRGRAAGGRINFDSGGGVAGAPYGASGMPYGGGQSLIPGMSITRGSGAPKPPSIPAPPTATQQMQQIGALAKTLTGGGNNPSSGVNPTVPGANNVTGLNYAPNGTPIVTPTFGVAGEMPDTAARGGRIGSYAGGGVANLPMHNRIMMPRGYADGGSPSEMDISQASIPDIPSEDFSPNYTMADVGLNPAPWTPSQMPTNFQAPVGVVPSNAAAPASGLPTEGGLGAMAAVPTGIAPSGLPTQGGLGDMASIPLEASGIEPPPAAAPLSDATNVAAPPGGVTLGGGPTQRVDIGGHGPASVRANNPGAQYPSTDAKRFGMVGYDIIGGGHQIAVFPSPVNGAAANFDLLDRNYTGLTVGQIGSKWTGGNGSGVPGYDPKMVVTKEMMADPNFAIPFMKAIASREAGQSNTIPDSDWMKAHEMFLAGGTPSGAPSGTNGVAVARDDNGVLPVHSMPTSGVAPNGVVPPVQNNIGPALMAAGFGMMASRSPFLGQAIGEGAMQGLASYTHSNEQEQTHKLKQSEIELEAKKLSQQADQFQQRQALEGKPYEQMTAKDKADLARRDSELKLHQQADERAALQPVVIGHVPDKYGNQIEVRGVKTSDGIRVINPVNGTLLPMGDSLPQMTPAHHAYENYIVPGVSENSVQTKGGAELDKDEAQIPENARLVSADLTPKTANPDFLKSLDPNDAALVKAIDEGRQPAPSLARPNKKNQQIMEWVNQYDPSFDASAAAARSGLRKSYLGAGKGGDNNASFDMAMQHIERFLNSAERLGNFTYAPGSMNKLRELYGSNFDTEYQSAAAAFNKDASAVATELMRATRGTGAGSVDEIRHWRDGLDITASPVTLRAAAKEAINLLEGRIYANGDRWNRGMNVDKDPLTWLSPKAQESFARIGNLDPAKPYTSIASPQNAASNPQNKQALDWANANPNDPRAAQIKQRLGVQ